MLNLGQAMIYPGKQQLRTKKIVCLGDSQTGYIQIAIQECSDEHNWTNLLAKRLNAEVINAGISGDTSRMLLNRFARDVLAHKPDFCILEEGGNDIFSNIPLNETFSNMTELVNLCRTNGIVPLIMNSAPGWDGWKFYEVHNISPVDMWERPGMLPDIRAWERQFCLDNNVPYIDVYTPMLGSTPNSNNREYFCQYDWVHPSVKGYQKIAEIVAEVMLPLLD